MQRADWLVALRKEIEDQGKNGKRLFTKNGLGSIFKTEYKTNA